MNAAKPNDNVTQIILTPYAGSSQEQSEIALSPDVRRRQVCLAKYLTRRAPGMSRTCRKRRNSATEWRLGRCYWSIRLAEGKGKGPDRGARQPGPAGSPGRARCNRE